MQGLGVVVGNLIIGVMLDVRQAWSLTSVWLFLLGLALASALSIRVLEGRGQIDQAARLAVKNA